MSCCDLGGVGSARFGWFCAGPSFLGDRRITTLAVATFREELSHAVRVLAGSSSGGPTGRLNFGDCRTAGIWYAQCMLRVCSGMLRYTGQETPRIQGHAQDSPRTHPRLSTQDMPRTLLVHKTPRARPKSPRPGHAQDSPRLGHDQDTPRTLHTQDTPRIRHAQDGWLTGGGLHQNLSIP